MIIHNQLSSVTWSINIITGLLVFLEASDRTLDQMRIQSIIQSMAKNNDPNVRYTTIQFS